MIGEFGTPESERGPARGVFLRVLARVVPEVISSLREDVLPVYVATYDEVASATSLEAAKARQVSYEAKYNTPRVVLCRQRFNVSRWHTVRQAGSGEYGDWMLYPDLLPLRKALEAWAESYHLKEAWILDAALVLLEMWRNFPQPEEHKDWDVWCWGDSMPTPWLPEFEHFSFEYPGWDPSLAKRKQAEESIREAFETRLKEYLDAVEERCSNLLLRSKRYRSLHQHLEWLVLYQVKGLNFCQIGRKVYVGSRTVSDYVHEVAELIGLELRTGRRGRPKKGSRTQD